MKQKLNKAMTAGILLSTLSGHATLTPNIERGDKNVYFTSPRGVQEVCVIPKHYADGKYSKKDLEKEAELCNYSFYSPAEAGQTTAAICAKENSTNPGVNIFEVPNGQTKTSVEAVDCEMNGASKIGKYKNSTSCSYAPGILAYYHVSRILGDIGNVPTSVLRSMDIQTHIKTGEKGIRQLKAGSLIYQTWDGLLKSLKSGLSSQYKDRLVTDDGQQSYGAFIQNPKKEEIYKELFNGGADQPARTQNFKGNTYFKMLTNSSAIENIVPAKWTAQNVQTLFAMKQVTEFILLDHLLNQQDRFGNIAYQNKVVYAKKNKSGELEIEFAKDMKEYEADRAAGKVSPETTPVTIKSIVLKDNDCSITKTPTIKNGGLLKMIRHMNPKTYKRLLEFQASIQSNQSFFTSGLMFTKVDMASVLANINDAVSILQGNCKNGSLKLDLDVEDYLLTGNSKTDQSCSL